MDFHVDNNYEWATHKPVIKAVLQLYKPDFAIELGAGYHSTLTLKDSGIRFVSIDDNKEWVDYLFTVYKADVKFHDTGLVNAEISFDKLTPLQRFDLIDFYNDIEIPENGLKLLFIDHFSCGRFIAINTLQPKVDMIIFHDSQPEGQVMFAYDKIDYSGWNIYVLKSPTSWTTLMVKKEIDKGYDELQQALQPWLFEFKMKYPEIPYMELFDKY